MNIDGSGRTKISSDGEQNQAANWSPDGRWIVFTQRIGQNNNIYLLSPNGRNQQFVVGGCNASFSPDGEWLIFSSVCESDSAIYKVRLNGTDLTRIGSVTGRNPVLSPDGQWLAFQKGTASIWLMQADGSDPRQIFENTAANSRTGVPGWRP
jgi:TolB protein